MANQELQVGDIVMDPALLRVGMRVYCSWRWAPISDRILDEVLLNPSSGFVCRVLDTGVTILALPDPAIEKPAARPLCDYDGHIAGCSCPPEPPRCAPGCTPAQPCRGVTCPEHREEMTGYNMVMDDKRSLCGAPDPNSAAAGCMEVVGHDGPCSFYDPPAREPRIGALSWSHATACGGLSTRRGQ